MRMRRRHRDDWPIPSGLAEVELFRFWEEDLLGDLPPEVLAVGPAGAAGPATPAPADPPAEPNAAPLWWAAGLVFLAVLMAIVV